MVIHFGWIFIYALIYVTGYIYDVYACSVRVRERETDRTPPPNTHTHRSNMIVYSPSGWQPGCNVQPLKIPIWNIRNIWRNHISMLK